MRKPETKLIHLKSSRATKSARANTSRSNRRSLRPSPSKASAQSRSTSSCRRKKSMRLYLNSPYYLVPDGDVGQQAFAVIREAIRKEGMVALGRVVFTSREHVIALEPRGKGLL